MKRVVAFVGTAHKRYTYAAVQNFLRRVEALGGVECEIVSLSDYRIETCRGCLACFDRGEERCPLRDDRDLLLQKMADADGVVFATPNYSFQVSGLMKCFLDRLGFAFHRPRFFGKSYTSIVCQGLYGGSKIVRYLDMVGVGLGFNTVRGSCLRSLHPMTEKAQAIIDATLDRQSRRFHARLTASAYPVPSILRLMLFRLSRSSMKRMLDGSNPDHAYFSAKGWLDSEYYYPTKLGGAKKAAGRLFDSIGGGLAKSWAR